jgi:hypothetical protein
VLCWVDMTIDAVILGVVHNSYTSDLYRPGPGPRAATRLGPTIVTGHRQCSDPRRFRPGSNDSTQTFLNISGFLGPFFFRKEKVIRSCTHLMLVTLSGNGNKSHDLILSGIFVAAPPRNSSR